MAKKKKKRNRKKSGHRHMVTPSTVASSPSQTQGIVPSSPPSSSPSLPDPSTEAVQLQPFGEGPRFTVLMAAYNRADLIGTAITSVLEQDFEDYELVIVDDGSTDGTPDVVKSFADSRIRYIRKAVNEGRSPTRNRAISEARGEYVLWMADDDLLMPGLLSLYNETLVAEPHIDVIYGNLQLFDHDSGQDLNLFEPNDWTERDRAIIGAKLYGSCVPDGGTANRRTLYGMVGPGPYDDEFVRAQDYELWTRIVGHARFRKVDATVYRYRKHSGGTSWGEFIDLTLDSKIIRRHLNRHPLSLLFSQFDWSFPEWATAQAYLRVAKNLRMYSDHTNAIRFLKAVEGWDRHPEAIEALVKAHIARGELQIARDIVASIDALLGHRHAVSDQLEQVVTDAQALSQRAQESLERGQPQAALELAREFIKAYEPTYHTALYRGHACLALGQREEAMHNFCLAARLNPEDRIAADALKPLVEEFGFSPKTDLAAMRRRLAETFIDLEPSTAPVCNEQPLVSILIPNTDENACRRSLLSVAHQDYDRIEVLLAGDGVSEDTLQAVAHIREDANRRPLDIKTRLVTSDGSRLGRHRELIGRTNGDYVVWLVDGAALYPTCLTHGARVLAGGASVVMMNGHYVRQTHGARSMISESFYFPEGIFQDTPCLVSPLLSLSMFMYASNADGVPSRFVETDTADWVFSVMLKRHPDVVRTARPSLSIPLNQDTDSADLTPQQYSDAYRYFSGYSAFDPATRDAQNKRIEPLGMRQASQGRTTIILLVRDNLSEVQSCLRQLDEATLTPYDFVISYAEDNEDCHRWVHELRETRDDVRGGKAPAGAQFAKTLNAGLARANGEFVVTITEPSQVTQGWLGRLQWIMSQDETIGAIMPEIVDEDRSGDWKERSRQAWKSQAYASNTIAQIDRRFFVCSRAALDRIGGFDVTLDAGSLVFDDMAHRLRIAGFNIVRTDDVIVSSTVLTHGTTTDQQDQFKARWGQLPPVSDVDAYRPFDPERDFCPAGAENGFRPDVFKLDVLEAGLHNCLVYPPWEDSEGMASLISTIAELPADVTIWLRTEPGTGDARIQQLSAHNFDCKAHVLIVDAHLAPEREGALYVRAGRVWTNDQWPQARQVIRRAIDCGCVIVRRPTDLVAWAMAVAEG